jgi:hypothetical protein
MSETANNNGRKKMNTRKHKAAAAKAELIKAMANPSRNAIQVTQAIDNWLYFATQSEVMRSWRKSWGRVPGWAA